MYLYKNIADNHSIAHSLLCIYMQYILIFVGKNLFYCVKIIIIEKKCKYSILANEPFYIYIKKSSEFMD